jgi:hypothetical protein
MTMFILPSVIFLRNLVYRIGEVRRRKIGIPSVTLMLECPRNGTDDLKIVSYQRTEPLDKFDFANEMN